MAFDLSNPIDWNLVLKSNLSQPSALVPIQPVSFVVASNQLTIGIYVPSAKKTWFSAGRLKQYVAQLPSSTATNYTALTKVGEFLLGLKSYQGITLVDALPKPYVCIIEFPPYFKNCQLEVWQNFKDRFQWRLLLLSVNIGMDNA